MTRTSGRKGWRRTSRPKWRPATPHFRPAVEPLEGRALLTGGGGQFEAFEGPYQFATAVAAGTDGDLYVANAGYDGPGGATGGSITKVAPDGTPLATYPLPSGMEGFTIAAATDGGIWVQGDTTIVRLAPDGTTAEYTVRSGYMVGSTSLAAGPDGSAWFVDNGISDPSYAAAVGASNVITPASIGRITPGGTITYFPVTDGTPSLVTAGPGGSADFVITKADGSTAIGQIKADGTESETSLGAGFDDMLSLTLGPDGNLWFLNDNAWTLADMDSNPPPGPVIGQLTPSGVLTTFTFTPSPGRPSIGQYPPGGLISGQDGNLYLIDNGSIDQVSTSGVVTETAVPGLSHGQGDTIGPDGNLWMADGTNSDFQVGLGRYTLGGTAPGHAPTPPPPVSGPSAPIPVTIPPPTPTPTPIAVPAPVPVVVPVTVITPTPAPPTAPATDVEVAHPIAPRVQTPQASPTPASSTGYDLLIPLEIAGVVPTVGLDVAGSDASAAGTTVGGHRLGHPSGLNLARDSSSTGS